MRKSTVVSLNKLRIFDILFRNRLLLILYFMFAIGILLGVISFKNSDVSANISEKLFSFYISKRISGNFISIMFSSAVISFLALIASFLLGASVMGIVVSPLFVSFLGFIYGEITAYIYSSYALNGIAFNAIVFIPSTAVLLISLIIACKYSVNFSLCIARLTFSNCISRNLYEEFKTYCRSYFVISAFIILSALLDALLSKILFKFFDF